jgi:methanogenic corrinoid protein MtbC1
LKRECACILPAAAWLGEERTVDIIKEIYEAVTEGKVEEASSGVQAALDSGSRV